MAFHANVNLEIRPQLNQVIALSEAKLASGPLISLSGALL